MTPINPYIAGNPVGGSVAFVGRTSMGRKVRAVLSSPAENALVLYGQRRIGKTSVLQDLKARLPHEGPYRPVLFDLQDKAALPLAQVVQELALRLAHELALPAPPAWGDDAPRAFRESFLPQVLNHLTDGSVLVLLFDEFDVLDSPGEAQAGAAFFPYLRDLLALDTRRLKFLFVIGRRPEELSNLAQSVFKSIGLEHVSLLPPDEAANLVRLSERNGTLRWTEEAVARVLALAGGHPLLTQQLCSLVWEYAYQDDPDESPTIGPGEVDAAVPRTLGSATNALEWLWSGLQPAQRVVASALAGAGPVAISEEQLEQRLIEGGVRIFMRELRDAPRVLQDWALLEPVAAGYRFRVELLRRWIAERKPLARAQEEVDRILPRAESLYQAALGDYRANDLEQASDLLRRALNLHPHHLRANELLADILIEQGSLTEARTMLEKLYEEQPAAARPRLVQVLLRLADGTVKESERLALFVAVLKIDHTNQKAISGYNSIWMHRGQSFLAAGQLEAARKSFQEASLDEAVREVSELIEQKKRLGDTYQQALAAWERGDKAAAQRGFAKVVSIEPSYGEATRYLYWATTGLDPNELYMKAKVEQTTRETIEERLSQETRARIRAEAQANEEATQRYKLAQKLEEIRIAQWTTVPLSNDLEPSEESNRRVTLSSLDSLRNLIPKRSSGYVVRELGITLYHLRAWNLLDHLRLLWWIFLVPERLAAYRRIFGKKAEKGVGTWLASTLAWLPIFIPTLALGLNLLPRTEQAWAATSYLWVSAGLCLVWLLTGAWETIETAIIGVVAFFVALGVAFFVTLGVALGVAGGGVSGAMVGMILIVVPVMAFVVAFGLAGGLALGVAFGVMLGVAPSMAFVVAFGLAFGLGSGVALSVASSAALGVFFCLGSVAADVAESVAKAVEQGEATPLTRSLFVLLVASHIFLIWFSFFGGWRLFSAS